MDMTAQQRTRAFRLRVLAHKVGHSTSCALILKQLNKPPPRLQSPLHSADKAHPHQLVKMAMDRLQVHFWRACQGHLTPPHSYNTALDTLTLTHL
eukprot:1137900-Pelagomonas_calceolata.AAC.3